jgi:hypothetical protein
LRVSACQIFVRWGVNPTYSHDWNASGVSEVKRSILIDPILAIKMITNSHLRDITKRWTAPPPALTL